MCWKCVRGMEILDCKTLFFQVFLIKLLPLLIRIVASVVFLL